MYFQLKNQAPQKSPDYNNLHLHPQYTSPTKAKRSVWFDLEATSLRNPRIPSQGAAGRRSSKIKEPEPFVPKDPAFEHTKQGARVDHLGGRAAKAKGMRIL